jgi:hypothetical protein
MMVSQGLSSMHGLIPVKGEHHMIKAIETRYAGCRFRSRLEARWAVFFDTLGIKWEYERQGYEIFDRLGICETKSWWYLPDFWLPEHEVHAEVKGSLTGAELRRLASAAAYLSAPQGGCGEGSDLILLGPIPYELSVSPFRLHMHKGELQVSPWRGDLAGPFHCWHEHHHLADDVEGIIDVPASQIIHKLLEGCPNTLSYAIREAYEAARSARFEHGEWG